MLSLSFMFLWLCPPQESKTPNLSSAISSYFFDRDLHALYFHQGHIPTGPLGLLIIIIFSPSFTRKPFYLSKKSHFEELAKFLIFFPFRRKYKAMSVACYWCFLPWNNLRLVISAANLRLAVLKPIIAGTSDSGEAPPWVVLCFLSLQGSHFFPLH